jgi:hypothetical protein
MLSDDGVATLFEDAEGSRAHGHEVSIAIADSGLDGGEAMCGTDGIASRLKFSEVRIPEGTGAYLRPQIFMHHNM